MKDDRETREIAEKLYKSPVEVTQYIYTYEPNKIYYSYTPFDEVYIRPNPDSKGLVLPDRRAVIAAKLVEDKLIYGVSICTIGDTWNKAKGRELAESRMRRGFGSVKMDSPLIANLLSKGENQRAVLTILNCLRNTIYLNIKDWQRKIGDFEAKQEEAVKAELKAKKSSSTRGVKKKSVRSVKKAAKRK